MRSLLVISSALLTSFALVACTEDPSASTGEDDYRSKPFGNDLSAGGLVVKAPTGPGVLGGHVDLWSTRERKAFGEIFAGLQLGSVKMNTTSESATIGGYATLEAPINPAKLTELTLAGLAIQRVGAPRTLGMPSNAIDGLTVAGRVSVQPTSDGSEVAPLAAGEYTFQWGLGDGITVTAVEGKIVKKELWEYKQRSVVRIVPPTRELPDACADHATVSNTRRSGYLDLSEAMEVGQNPSVMGTVELASTIDLQLPCVWGPTQIPVPAVGVGPKDFKIGRLDVDDVLVTMADGSTKPVRGSYRVLTSDGTTEVLRIRPATNTGVDLPPGKYKLVVEYPTTAGTTASYEETFTTP